MITNLVIFVRWLIVWHSYPLKRVQEGMDFLKQTIISEANELLSYFDTTYVNGSYKRVSAGMNIKLRKTKSLISTKYVECL